MALRGSPARRMIGNPMGGMLRDIDRRTRSTTRRSRPSKPREGLTEPPAGPPGERGPAGPPGPPGVAITAATVAVTSEDGCARWEFSTPYAAPPVLTALPVDPDPDGDRTVMATLEAVTETYAVVRVWRTRPLRGKGVVEMAGPGMAVHLTATAAES